MTDVCLMGLQGLVDKHIGCHSQVRIVYVQFDYDSCLTCFLTCGIFLSCIASQLQDEVILDTMQPQSLRSSSGKFNCYLIHTQV